MSKLHLYKDAKTNEPKKKEILGAEEIKATGNYVIVPAYDNKSKGENEGTR